MRLWCLEPMRSLTLLALFPLVACGSDPVGELASSPERADTLASEGDVPPDVVAPEWEGPEGSESRDRRRAAPRQEELDDESPGEVSDDVTPRGPLGGERPAKVILPEAYDSQEAWPLVMLLHGYSADGFIQDYYLGVSDKLDARGFIFIRPEGTVDSDNKQFWNAVPGCCDWDDSGVDDLGYLSGLLDEALERYHVDRTRIVLIGHSNGGYMSHRLACERADVVTAIASIAGTSFQDMSGLCLAERPVSILQVHGTLDTTVLYATPFAGLGAEETAEWWAERDACGTSLSLDDADYDQMVWGAETLVSRWEDCADDTAVELWKMVGTSHIPLFSEGFMDDVLDFLLGHARAHTP